MNRIAFSPHWLLLAPPWLLAALAADGERTPSIMAMMHKQYTVSRAPFKIIRNEIDARSPDWAKMREASAKFVDLAGALAKNTPHEGTSESWRQLIDRHMADARAMSEAAETRD